MGRENGNVPATNPNAQHLLLDSVKCHCEEWEGGVSRCRSRMLPALDSLPCGVQGQSSKDLHPWWTQNNGAVEGFEFPLWQIMPWSFVGLWIFLTLSSLGANDSKEIMCKGQRSKYFQASISLPCSSLWLLLPASHLVGLQKGALKSSSFILHCH